MCGFFFAVTPQSLSDGIVKRATRYIQRRGPDKEHVYRAITNNDQHLISSHYLLNVSGQTALQPILIAGKSDTPRFLILFNGEVYNYKDISLNTSSDTEALAQLIKADGSIPYDKLDGEYAILVYDFLLNRVTVATDQFMTKPVSVGWSSDRSIFGVASYPSALEAIGATELAYSTPNSVLSFQIDTPSQWSLPAGSPSVDNVTYHYDLDQRVEHYDSWEARFLESVSIRAKHGSLPCFVPLSSGYDSGAICLALNILGIDYHTITIDSAEDQSVLARRLEVNSSAGGSCLEHISLPPLSLRECEVIRRMIKRDCQPFEFIHSNQTLLDDDGSIGAFRVAETAKSRGWLVCLSGCGADEIISDYGFNGIKHYSHSQFGGLFPDSLHGFFPWNKFYEDTMRSYLFKDELVFGIFGIEGRYPFLDKTLTQEFLALSSNLKNLEYKAPIAKFLRKHNYPFENGVKRGFSPYADNPSTNQSKDPRLLRFILAIKSTLNKIRL